MIRPVIELITRSVGIHTNTMNNQKQTVITNVLDF